MKKRMFGMIVTAVLLLCILPASVYAGNDHTHTGDAPDSTCIVCKVAGMINALPAAKDITVNNAAAVTEQIHAIDRVKVELSDTQYAEMIVLVEHGNDGTGYGVDIPLKYQAAVKTIKELTGGGSLYAMKSYAVGDTKLNWSKTNATFRIECIDTTSAFEPLSVTLAQIESESNSLTGFYSATENGWTNTYILPAGIYKITETGSNTVTEDGVHLATTPTYYVDGVESTDYAVVEVKNGESSVVTLFNESSCYEINIIFEDSEGSSIDAESIDAELQLVQKNPSNFTPTVYTFNETNEYTQIGVPSDLYLVNISINESGYIAPDLNGLYLSLRQVMFMQIDGDEYDYNDKAVSSITGIDLSKNNDHDGNCSGGNCSGTITITITLSDTYSITCDNENPENGSFYVSKIGDSEKNEPENESEDVYAPVGSVITLSVEPASNYVHNSMSCSYYIYKSDESGDNIDLDITGEYTPYTDENGNSCLQEPTEYTFTMPAYDVYASVGFTTGTVIFFEIPEKTDSTWDTFQAMYKDDVEGVFPVPDSFKITAGDKEYYRVVVPENCNSVFFMNFISTANENIEYEALWSDWTDDIIAYKIYKFEKSDKTYSDMVGSTSETPSPSADNFYTRWGRAIWMLYVQQFEIAAEASEGGRITPAGVTEVFYDRSKTYTVTPDAGYRIADVQIDGISIGAVTEYTFKRVHEDHTIYVEFEKLPEEAEEAEAAE